jgi:Sigma-70, region 4
VDPVTESFADEVITRVTALDARVQLAGALARLKSGDRDVLLLIAWADMSYEEVSESLGIPVGTVRSRLHRARVQVRQSLGAHPDPRLTPLTRRTSAMDDLELLRELRSNVPPPSRHAISSASRRLEQATGRTGSPFPASTGARWSWRPRRLTRLAVAGGLAFAVAAGIFASQAAQSGRTRPADGRARLAAWTVIRQPDGELRIYVRQLRDPACLQAMLRRDGVPVRLEFVHHHIQATTSTRIIPHSCRNLSMSDEAQSKLEDKAFPPTETRPNKDGISKEEPWILAVRPSALPAGVGMFWQVWLPGKAPRPAVWNLVLVQASRRCTGS